MDHHDWHRRDDYDSDDERRGHRDRKNDNWGTRLFRSLSRAPKERERERSESRPGRHGDWSSTTGGRRHHLKSSVGMLDDTSHPVPCRDDLLTARGERDRSRVRCREHLMDRQPRSEPRSNRLVREETPEGRRRCKSTGYIDNSNKDHHSSPQPPKVCSVREEIPNALQTHLLDEERFPATTSVPVRDVFARIISALPATLATPTATTGDDT